MNLKEVLSIAGQPGLFKYVAQAKGGIIVESLSAEAKRTMVSGSAKVSALGDIAIFTDEAEVPLAEIFENIYKINEGKPTQITSKSSPEELTGFMQEALATYDKERVHNSDIKKLASWYNILVACGATSFNDEQVSDEESEVATSVAVAEKTTKPRHVAAAPVKAKQTASSKPKVTATKSTTARKSS